MNLIIIPQKMEGGTITAVAVKQEGKEEVFNIPPAPFENFEAMKAVIEKYYELEDIWQNSKQEYESAKQRFDLIDFRHKAALQDFKLLISPKETQKIVSTLKLPAEYGIKYETPVSKLEVTKTGGIESAITQEPKPEPLVITSQESIAMKGTSPPHKLEVVDSRKIMPPSTPTEMALEQSQASQERAEQAGTEFQRADVIIDQPKAIVQTLPEEPESEVKKILKERPSLLTQEVKDVLPEKAKRVLEGIEGRIEAAKEMTDTSKPLPTSKKPKPISVQDWVKEVDTKITDKLENTEFNEDRLEDELISYGVPEGQVEKVRDQLIKSWEKDGRFEKKENSFFLKLKSLTQKVLGGKKKKKVE